MRLMTSVMATILLVAFNGAESASAANSGLRLVLADGHVIRLDGMGNRVSGPPPLLDGFRSANEQIFTVAADYRYGKLYVTPESRYENRRTIVFDLVSLHKLAVLPGVTEVVIPESNDVDFLTTRTFVSRAGTSFSSHRELHQNADSQEIQYRSRNLPSHVLATSPDDWRLGWGIFRCYSSVHRAFYVPIAGKMIDAKLKLVPAASGSRDGPAGDVVGCWPSGAVWKAEEPSPRASEVMYDRISVQGTGKAPSATWKLKRSLAAEDTTWLEFGRSPSAIAAIDRSAAHVAGSIIGTLYLIPSRHKPVAIQLPKELPAKNGWFVQPIAQSFDRNQWFFTTARFRSGGLSMQTSDQLFVVSVGAERPLKAVALPKELLRINLASHIELDENKSSDEKRKALELLGPASDDLSAIRSVQLVSVLRE